MFDFRSDTVTKPTPEMMTAIANAEVGDSARGDDPTHNRLEAVAAEMAGKEAAIFVPSGTMANLAALLTHTRPGDEVILEEKAHIFNSEVGSISAVGGAVPRPIRGINGFLSADDVAAAIKTGDVQSAAPTGLICVENTLNSVGGTVLPIGRMAELHNVARDAGIPVHLDGARLFNAAAFLKCPVSDICRHVDSVMFALSKGLGAPIGSMLAGSADFIARARKKARMIGGGMRQTGLLAAPALVALDDPFPGLLRDHARARMLGEGLAAIDESLVQLGTVQTNIVNCHIDRFASDATGFVKALNKQSVLANFARTKVRFVTHRHIDEAAVKACLEAVEKIIGEPGLAA
jgi:threonine aldolase